MKAFLMLLIIVVVATPLLAESQRNSAREITSRPEYKDYKIVRSPGDSSSQTGGRGSGGGDEDSAARRRAEGRDDTPQRRSSGSGRPMDIGWFGDVLKFFMWGIFIVGIAIALYFIVKALVGIKWRRGKNAKASAKAVAKNATQSVEQNIDEPAYEEMAPAFRDALDLALEGFEKAVSAKEWDRATLLAYRIFWIKAGWRGCVEDEDVRTWRDAIRMVQTQEHRIGVNRLLPLVEHIRYGEHTPSETEFKTWYQQLKTLPTRGILA